MIFFLKSCCSLNIYRSVGDGDNNNNQRKGVLAADTLLSLSESGDAERDAAPPACLQPELVKREVFRGGCRGAMCNPPQPAQARALPRAPAAQPCPSGSVHACPSLHSHFKNIICLRVSGCLICAWPGSVAHRQPWAARVPVRADTLWVCTGRTASAAPRPQPCLCRAQKENKPGSSFCTLMLFFPPLSLPLCHL